ncbi:hypothetical protein K435DRAFT_796899 [Dendrothele bispora CBS 962.96]|uniref:Uncharacterized protein n=1 Tax=Dendrothele bispora (strain CBS 962.96) TaxID=1314807 RepID=A0A4S8M479_DENBC|nr:hypothetical protein K435DRAFT_796899 [Dendrothele bispora CBS 962.96]
MDPRNPSFFHSARQLEFRDSTVNNIHGNFYQSISTIVSEHEEFVISNLRSLRPSDPMNEYYVAVLHVRGMNSLQAVIRRFNRTEDRDRFIALLGKHWWNPLVMRKLWALTIHGDPCLVVDSAAVYTWREAVQGNLIKDNQMTRVKFYLQTYQFCQHEAGTDVERRVWITSGGKENMGVQKLRLFSMEGSIVLDPEKLELDDQIRNEYQMIQPKEDILHQDLRSIISSKWGTVWADELMRSTAYRINMMMLYGNAWERLQVLSSYSDLSYLLDEGGFCYEPKCYFLVPLLTAFDWDVVKVNPFKPKCSFPAPLLTAIKAWYEVNPFKQKCSFPVPLLTAAYKRANETYNKNQSQDDEDQFEDLSDSSDDNEEIATDSPVMPPKPELLQTAAPFLFIESVDAMDVDD